MRQAIFIVMFLTGLVVLDCAEKPDVVLTPAEIAADINSDHYGFSTSVFRGLSWAESRDGTMTNDNGVIYSDDYKVLIKQQWVRDYPHRELLQRMYGFYIYGSWGRLQVNYLCARDYGFQGPPWGLNDINTNYKYGGAIYRHYLDIYHTAKRAAAAYNYGSVKYKENGDFINQEYVDHFMSHYTQNYPGGYKE